jgi:hypothetical protein
VGRSFRGDLQVGASFGAGKGLSYDSAHSLAWGLDGSLGWRGWRLNAECLQLYHASGSCSFAYGKLAYEKLGAWKPYVASYAWNDAAGIFGRLRSTVYGLNYLLTPELALEGAYAATSDRGLYWIQAHWTWER